MMHTSAPNSSISILMPVKNAGPWITACIQSILDQSHKDWELIIVNDGCTDSTERHVKPFLQSDNVKWINNIGSGIISALQTAFDHAKFNLVTRMDADDLMPVNKLELFYKTHQKNPNSIVTGMVSYFSNHEISRGYQKYEAWLNQRIHLNDYSIWAYRECVIASANWLCTKNIITQVGAFKDLDYPEDYDLTLRWIQAGTPIVGVKTITHLWREHNLRTSRTSPNYQQPAFFRLKLNAWIKKYGSNPVVLWGSGKKQALAQQVFKKASIATILVGLKQTDTASAYTSIDLNEKPRILLCVYPQQEERDRLVEYLNNGGLVMGEHYWFL